MQLALNIECKDATLSIRKSPDHALVLTCESLEYFSVVLTFCSPQLKDVSQKAGLSFQRLDSVRVPFLLLLPPLLCDLKDILKTSSSLETSAQSNCTTRVVFVVIAAAVVAADLETVRFG